MAATRGFLDPGGVLENDDGSIFIDGAGSVKIRATGSGAGPLVTHFRMVPVPTDTTGSVVFVDLLVVPGGVTVINEGNVLLDFDASVQMTPAGDAGAFDGTNFQFLWDGAPLPDNAFFDMDMQSANVFNTFAVGVRFRSLILDAPVGNHTLSVQWSVNDADDTVSSFLGSGNLTIQTAPR